MQISDSSEVRRVDRMSGGWFSKGKARTKRSSIVWARSPRFTRGLNCSLGNFFEVKEWVFLFKA